MGTLDTWLTRTVWNADDYLRNPDPNWQQRFIDKSDEMRDRGLTDGVPIFLTNDPEISGEVIIMRTWASEEAAEEWQTFIAPYNPLSSITYQD